MPDSFSDPEAARRSGEKVARKNPESGDDENSFFSEIGLSDGRAGGISPTAGAAKPEFSAKRKPATTGAEASRESKANKRLRHWPPAWQIITGVGVAFVVVILVVAANLGNPAPTQIPPATPKSIAAPAGSESSPIQFGPRTVTGPVDDRTVLSPVTGLSAQVPVERHGDLMLADVRINDVDAGNFLLDTGTRDLIISKDLGDKLHLPARRSKNLQMPGGMQAVTERKIESLAMGSVKFEERMILPPPRNDEWLVLAVDIKPWAAAVHLPIAGVIGGDVWSQLPFSIDPAHNLVTFFKRGPFPFSAGLEPEFLTQFDFVKPAITANLDHGPDGTFLLATGAPAELMLKGAAAPVKTLRALGQEIPDPKTIESKTGDGYFDTNNDRQSGVIGAGILSHYLLMFDYAGEKFLAVPSKKSK